ncbi:MAG: type IX secretion system sortase PorU [Caldithrix sp.]|nr:type IX secretion system sortase PorU [Caldithrix sp.]
MHLKRFITILTVCLSVSSFSTVRADNRQDDLTIIESNNRYMVVEWTPQNIQYEEIIINNQPFVHINFKNSHERYEPGRPNIPFRTFTLGLPPAGTIQVDVLDSDRQIKRQIKPAPVPRLFKNKNGLSDYRYKPDPQHYQSQQNQPASITQVSKPSQFRDVRIQRLHISPFQYNAATTELTIYTRLRLRINYQYADQFNKGVSPKNTPDNELYKALLLNYDQAQAWQKPPAAGTLKKAASLPSGPWYRIAVQEDGLYKITFNTLNSAGANVDNLSTDQIRMFNNGGHSLNIDVNEDYYNPPQTREIPIIVRDPNSNDQFDSGDYILFYGKHLNGWFLNHNKGTFEYHNHDYDTQNSYWLTVGNGQGRNMTIEDSDNLSNAQSVNFFYDRYHFEEDKYNLLASGPDWYGYRFFGKSDNYTKSFDINTNQAAGASPEFKIQLKGASGVKYGDDLGYRYYFDIILNNIKLFDNLSFTTESRRDYKKNLEDPTTLNNGQNNLSIQYTGNYEGCAAHLDWFEIRYPRELAADGDRLSFYTRATGQNERYTITGLNNKDDYLVLDITDPANPIILEQNAAVQNGSLTLDIAGEISEQNILVSSLSSPKIKSVTQLKRFEGFDNLLAENQQTDFIIVTHKTFKPYAEEIARLRSELNSKIVTMEDIYFNFNSGVADPTALRNFIRHAYYNWQNPSPTYVLLFGDGHYDYRNITLPDTMRVPPFEIYDTGEINSRTTDNYFVDLQYSSGSGFRILSPDLAIGRLPVESILDCQRVVQKLKQYEENPVRDGWQTNLVMVGDDEVTTSSTSQWEHQRQAEDLATLSPLNKFIKQKVYLSAYPSVAGGFGRVKPQANEDVIDHFNRGALVVNYVGHGSPVQWAHEAVFNLNRDLSRINNAGKLPLLIAATCDFGKYDDPHEPSFSEALIWKENSGVIGVLAASRLVYSGQNFQFNKRFYEELFPGGAPSRRLGIAKLLATYSGVNDQKYHLLADPTMHLADPRQEIQIHSISPDTLKALSEVTVDATIYKQNTPNNNFDGGAVLIVQDAAYDDVTYGGGEYFTMPGPTLFKGEVSVQNGHLTGRFIVPKSIRFLNKYSGRITLYAWDEASDQDAIGFNNQLLIYGSVSNRNDTDGPEIDIYFKDQESFTTGDLIPQNPVLKVDVSDESGINMTGETGHNISIQLDEEVPKDISGFFFYKKDSYKEGSIQYSLDQLDNGNHTLQLTAFDNLNNPATEEIYFRIAQSSGLVLRDVVNYPNPFSGSTRFTFQTNKSGVDVQVKIYTLTGRLIQELYGFSENGFNSNIEWNGLDRDGNTLANGVYLYKLILKNGKEKEEKIEKLMIMR